MHENVSCTGCRTKPVFTNVGKNCADCHADIHRAQFGTNCVQCHTVLGWQVSVQVSWLRLRAGGFFAWLFSLFGILPTRNPELEYAIHTARRQASLSKRNLFLSRTKQVFNLWHVIHHPFS